MVPVAPDAHSPRLLYIDNKAETSPGLDRLIAGQTERGWSVRTAPSGQTALACLKEGQFEIVVADVECLDDLPGDSESAISKLVRQSGDAIFIAVCPKQSVSQAVGAMRAGAHDYVAKPIDAAAFDARLRDLSKRHARVDVRSKAKDLPPALAGMSPLVQQLRHQLMRLAPSSAPVMLTGERGTGKSDCARYLHKTSPRADFPFVEMDCAALENELLRDPSVATSQADKLADAALRAEGGVLFVSSAEALSADLQSRLLTLVQTEAPNVRLITAFNVLPHDLLQAGLLRQDLYYRLQVLPVHLPPLRQRRDDVSAIARSILDVGSSPLATDHLDLIRSVTASSAAHVWEGNIISLRKALMQAKGMGQDTESSNEANLISHPDNLVAMPQRVHIEPCSKILPMWKQEQRIIEDAIAACNGNVAQAAAALEISPSTIYRKRQSWLEQESGLGVA